METFADYILNEKDLASKMEIMYYLSKKSNIFFNKSTVFKTEIARLFMNYSKVDVDKNLVLTASLLCNCKKVDNAQDINKIHTYAKEGAEYVKTLGFEDKFCKMCEEVNRYSNSNPREKESDILELADQFGGMLLDRPDRIGFKPPEASVLLEHRNLKEVYNRYLNTFLEFVKYMEKINIGETVKMPSLRRLVKIYHETDDVTNFIKKVVYKFEPTIDELVGEKKQHAEEKELETIGEINNRIDPNRSLFSEETTRKIMSSLNTKDGNTVGVGTDYEER